ncbi:MAG: hypothetical protein M3356_05110 [Actinomycetota bacterium]|nr:hypothetical protein [Actinomycetota bacterium]
MRIDELLGDLAAIAPQARLSLSERLPTASVSLSALLEGAREPVTGTTSVTLAESTEELLASGLPGVRPLSG